MAGLAARYLQAFPQSAGMFERARGSIPQGVHSHVRHVAPFPVYAERARGCRKQLIDGPRVIDYWMGHASLLFGHADEQVLAAAQEQLARGTHYAAPTALEVELAERVSSFLPWADRVRFCGTGSESVALALRLARAVTGRKRFVRFAGHYHGWFDEIVPGTLPEAVMSYEGIPAEQRGLVDVLPPNDLDPVEAALRGGDVAAILLEPTGGSGGALPNAPGFLAGLRQLADRHGALLIFDEMISGFRFARGGAAERHGVTPHLATYGKALFGGFPGAAVAGPADIMDRLGPRAGAQVLHQGTWNAAPLAMAAGSQTLARLAGEDVTAALDQRATWLRAALTETLAEHGVVGHVYGESSLVHVCLGAWPLPPDASATSLQQVAMVQAARAAPANLALRLAMLLEGVDFFPIHMNALSLAHGREDIDATAAALRRALRLLTAEGIV
jgi:glutamate-1-semialdehyde 2,1-aminomutase